MTRPIRLGIQVWPQTDDWRSIARAGERVDRLGYDYLFLWDHLMSPVAPPAVPVLEGYTTLAALAVITARVRLGLLVGANPFRNPALVAKMVTTIDVISGGRAILGLGAGWHRDEHRAFGIEFGSGFGERLDWLEEALGIAAPLVRGIDSSSVGTRYRTDSLTLAPPPVDGPIPILVGGAGEVKTLASVARHADIWSSGVPLDVASTKLSALHSHCDRIGRDPARIEAAIVANIVIRSAEGSARRASRTIFEAAGMDMSTPNHSFWSGSPAQIADRMIAYKRLGFTTFIGALPPPYDEETMTRLIEEVRPLVAAETSVSSNPT